MADLCRKCVVTPLPLEAVELVWLRHGMKAVCVPAQRLIVIDPDFWNRVPSTTGRAAVFFHEFAHVEGAVCESCADKRAGELLARWGFNFRDAGRTYCQTIEHRPRAPFDLADGYGG